MRYIKNFNRNSIKKGVKLRLLEDDNHFSYFTIGDFYPEFGWEIKPKGHGGIRYTGNLLYIRPFDFPGDYELLSEQ